MTKYRFTVVVEMDEDGVYVATCPAIQGCYTQGATYKEAIRNVKDAIIPIETAVEEVELIEQATPSQA